MSSKKRKKRHQKATRSNVGASTKALGLDKGCLKCGKPGAHFVPPSLGDIGFFACDPPADIRNHTRD